MKFGMKIWVLGDDRIGNTNQAIALACELNKDFDLIKLEYNCFGKLPNFILQWYPIHIPRKLLHSLVEKILSSNNLSIPQIIITAGRRAAPLAIYLKKKLEDKVKLIQIMRPCIAYDKFDIVILPSHDVVRQEATNVVKITGALTNIAAKLTEGKIELKKHYPTLGKFIAVIIGGNSKNYNFSAKDGMLFASLLNETYKSTGLPFFISFSRRTPEPVKRVIKSNLPTSRIIYDPSLLHKLRFNPYIGMLGNAEYVISTADSISMCSDAAACGKPLYIFCPKSFNSPKHKAFINRLLEQKIARIFDESNAFLEKYKYNYTPLNEAQKVAQTIKKKFYSSISERSL
jgi:mitochondrial fission protein ELM1